MSDTERIEGILRVADGVIPQVEAIHPTEHIPDQVMRTAIRVSRELDIAVDHGVDAELLARIDERRARLAAQSMPTNYKP